MFQAKDASGNDLSAVKITMDGELLAERLDGTLLTLDPGEHGFTFEMAGHLPIQKQLVIRESEKGRHEIITIADSGSPPAQVPPPVATSAAAVNAGTQVQPAPTPVTAVSPSPVGQTDRPPSPVLLAPTEPEVDHGSRAPAYVVGGIGAAGIVAGLVMRIMAFGEKSTIEKHCDFNKICDQTGMDAVSRATTFQTVSGISLIVGTVALGAGMYLGLSSTEKKESPRAALHPMVLPKGGAIALTSWF